MSFKVNPIHIFSSALVLFVIIAVFVLYFMYKTSVTNYIAWGFMIVLTFFLLFMLYSINLGFKVSEKQLQEIQKNKDTLLFDETGFTVRLTILKIQQSVKWNTVEAVFLENAPPREGDYYSFRYIIFLNKPFIETPDKDIKRYNKQVDNTGTVLYINDYKNSSFAHFNTNLQRYLSGVNPMTEEYLRLKYGNDPARRNTIDYRLKTYTIYTIFDRGNATNNTEFINHRKHTNNKPHVTID